MFRFFTWNLSCWRSSSVGPAFAGLARRYNLLKSPSFTNICACPLFDFGHGELAVHTTRTIRAVVTTWAVLAGVFVAGDFDAKIGPGVVR